MVLHANNPKTEIMEAQLRSSRTARAGKKSVIIVTEEATTWSFLDLE